MHADHLCTPEAHLGTWPPPPPNSILVPPFFSPCQPASLFSDVPPSPTFHPEVITSIPPPPTFHPGTTNSQQTIPDIPPSQSPPPEDQIPSDPELTESSCSEAESWAEDEAELSSDDQNSAKSKRFVKRRVKKTSLSAESSDEEDEEPIQKRRRRKVLLRRVNPSPSLTESSGGETPYLAGSSEGEEPGVESMGGKVVGNMKGGAGESYEQVLTIAIHKAGEHLKLDEPTLGDGSCFSHAIVQQCRRRPVKLFLQSRGVTVSDFMHLKKSVAQFIQANINTQKVQNLRVNFDVSQLNMHWEGLQKRSWSDYWKDMQRPKGLRAWADNIFVQATAWYLNVDLRIIYAGADTQGQTVTTTDGNFSPVAGGERRPLLYLGYIVNEHYQSLLPAVEDDYVPPCLAQPAVDNALQNALQALMEAKAKQGTQVSSKKTISSHQTSKSAHFTTYFDYFRIRHQQLRSLSTARKHQTQHVAMNR